VAVQLDSELGIFVVDATCCFRVSMTVFLLVQNHETSYHGSNDYRSYAAN